jgi:hypothetical protein
MTLKELVEEIREEVGWFDADEQRKTQNIGRLIIKIEDLI